MTKWSRCGKCLAWLAPKVSCARCVRVPDAAEDERSSFSNHTARLAKIVEPIKVTPKEITSECIECGHTFVLSKNKPGKINLCEECSGSDVQVMTGVMVYGGKNAAEIQINKDPKLTAYMLNARMTGCSVPSVTKNSGQTAKVVTGLENRRHGDSK